MSFATHISITGAAMAGLVVWLLTGTPVASAEQTATESVKSTVDEVIHLLNSGELKQPGHSLE